MPVSNNLHMPDALAVAARAHFDTPVTRMTTPGGPARNSARLHLADNRVVIGAHRPDPVCLAREVALMHALDGASGHATRCLGTHGPFLFYEDAGTDRLSHVLARLTGADRRRVATSAIQSLAAVRAAAFGTDALKDAPALALSSDWLIRFATTPLRLSQALQLDPPDLDLTALAASLAASPDAFIRWDARPGNAAVDPQGRVIWFDCQDFGRRAGVEDIAMLIGDEFWPLGPAETLAAIAQACPDITDLPFLTRFATLQVCTRLLMICEQAARDGWHTSDHLLRLDLVGTAPELVASLAKRGAGFAVHHDLTRPLAPWFRGIATARWPVPASSAA